MLEEVVVTPLNPDRLRSVLTPDALAGFEHTLARGREMLSTRTLWTVNSTARGGGVAEMLRSLIGYTRGGGSQARWLVIDGDDEFFRVTKRLHNRLHGNEGDDGPLGEAERSTYERHCGANAEAMVAQIGPADVVLLHDPQTAGMAPRLLETGVPVIWRSHVGIDPPNDLARSAWEFLTPYIREADAFVFSYRPYFWDGLDVAKLMVIAPSIDAFAPKNQTMSFTSVTAVLRASGLAADRYQRHARAIFERLDGTLGRVQRKARLVEDAPLWLGVPLLAQVSRWDRLKDPIGVLTGFIEHVAPRTPDAHLALVGPEVVGVSDDPEGATVLSEVSEQWHRLPVPLRKRVHLISLPMADSDLNAVMVNAIQRHARVVVQKSLAEGFGLTVAEALWKARPVVASAVGGIQDQIEPGVSGILVEPRVLGAFGDATVHLLSDTNAATAMGERARDRVRHHFLGPRHLLQYFDLVAAL